MQAMFARSKFNQDISKWDTSAAISIKNIFLGAIIEKPYWDIEDYEQRKNAIKHYKLKNKLEKSIEAIDNKNTKPKI